MKNIFLLKPAIVGLLLLTACAEDDNEAAPHWQLSEQYVLDTMMLSGASLREAVASGQFVPESRGDLPDGVFTHYAHMAARMRLTPPPALYLDTADRRAVPQSAARFTREGKPYILINAAALSFWNARELTAVFGHELVHLFARHVTPAELSEAYNTPGLSAAHELEADRIGAGPAGSCDPAALESALEVVIAANQRSRASAAIEPEGVPSDLTPADHPAWQTRKAALDSMIAVPPDGCTASD